MVWSNNFPRSFDVGSATAGHAHFDANGVTFFGTDGTTVLFHYDFASATLTIGDANSNMVAFVQDAPIGIIGWLLNLTGISNAGAVEALSRADTLNPPGANEPTLRLLSPSKVGELAAILDLVSGPNPVANVVQGDLEVAGMSLSRGILGPPVLFADTGPVSADTVIASGTYNVVAGRRYKATGTSFLCPTTVASDRFTFTHKAGAVVMGNAGQSALYPVATNNLPPTVIATWLSNVTGAVTFTFHVVRAAGTGTINVQHGEFFVEDIGAL